MLNQSLDIQSFSHEDRQGLLSSLMLVIADCGGWIMHRKNTSATTVEIQLEIQLRSIEDLYASIAASGVELTRSGHASLTGLCTARRVFANLAELGQVIEIRLEICFSGPPDHTAALPATAGVA